MVLLETIRAKLSDHHYVSCSIVEKRHETELSM